MGKKKGGAAQDNTAAEKAKAEEAAAAKAKAEGDSADEEEDTPTIKQLKEIDDKYCAAQVELEREIEKKRKEFTARQAPLLEERLQVLSETSGCAPDEAALGTPACKEFWLQAMQNCSDISQTVEKWDEPILHYLHDIKKTDLDAEVPQKGFRLDYIFKENPFFTGTCLWCEFHTDFDAATYKPYKEEECIEFKASPIEWKAGKNVTVEKVKQDGGGKKGKRKPAKAKEEPRMSFFRIMFTPVKQDEPMDDDLRKTIFDDDEDEDDDEMVGEHLENLYDLGRMVGEQFVPYAVRYYTGEACDDDDDDDDEDEEEEEEDDDDDDDDDDDEDEPPKKPAGKAKAQKKAGGGAEPGQKQEECKQQ